MCPAGVGYLKEKCDLRFRNRHIVVYQNTSVPCLGRSVIVYPFTQGCGAHDPKIRQIHIISPSSGHVVFLRFLSLIHLEKVYTVRENFC